MLQLDPRRPRDVAGQERAGDAGAGVQPGEQRPHARHQALARAGAADLLAEQIAIAGMEPAARPGFGHHAGALEGVMEDQRVRAAGDRDAVEAAGDAEQLLERPVQGAFPGPARQQQGPVDVEQDELRRPVAHY